MTKTSDKSRKWMWWFLAVGVALQLYFVRELLAAFALFAAGFAVIGLGIAALYLMQKAWEVGVARFADSQSPAAEHGAPRRCGHGRIGPPSVPPPRLAAKQFSGFSQNTHGTNIQSSFVKKTNRPERAVGLLIFLRWFSRRNFLAYLLPGPA